MADAPRDPLELHAQTVSMIESAIAAATATANGQMSQAQLFLAGGVGDAPPEGLREPIQPGAADAPNQ